jgi:hypothetical protein
MLIKGKYIFIDMYLVKGKKFKFFGHNFPCPRREFRAYSPAGQLAKHVAANQRTSFYVIIKILGIGSPAPEGKIKRTVPPDNLQSMYLQTSIHVCA